MAKNRPGFGNAKERAKDKYGPGSGGSKPKPPPTNPTPADTGFGPDNPNHPGYIPPASSGGSSGSGSSGPGIDPFSSLDTSGANWVKFKINGVTFWRNKNNGRVADMAGRFVGQWANGAVNWFASPTPSTPDPGTDEEPEEDEETEDRPDQPPAVPGYKWTWDDDQQVWVPVADAAAVDVGAQESLRAELRGILDQFGLASEGNIALLEKAVREDWSPTKFMQELRQSSDYLANPLFAANVERAKTGKGFMPEGQVLAYATEAKRLAKQFGYKEPSDNYIAQGFQSGLSLSEYEHRFAVQQRVNTFGAGVSLAYKQLMGIDPSDEDLYEIFDKEISTSEFDEKARRAEYMGRPLTLGLGIRTEAEARAAEMMGISPDEWFSRFENVSQNASRFERLRTIEDLISQGLPSNFGEHLATAENGLLIQALVFQRPDALAKLQDLTAKEVARFKTGGGTQATQGQLVGLLSQAEKQSYG